MLVEQLMARITQLETQLEEANAKNKLQAQKLKEAEAMINDLLTGGVPSGGLSHVRHDQPGNSIRFMQGSPY
jgi:hypothetical protein